MHRAVLLWWIKWNQQSYIVMAQCTCQAETGEQWIDTVIALGNMGDCLVAMWWCTCLQDHTTRLIVYVCVCVCLHKKDHRQPYQLNTGRTTSWLISRLAETHTYVDKQVYSSHVRFHGNQSVTNNFFMITAEIYREQHWLSSFLQTTVVHCSQDLACLYPLVVLETDPSLLF